MWIVIFEAERSDRRHLRDVFARLRPMEMPGFAWKNDDASRRIGLHLVAIEGLPEPNIKHARHDRVDSILSMLVRQKLHTGRDLDPDDIRSGLTRVSDKHREPNRRRERRERLPVDVFRQDRSESVFTRLVNTNHRASPYLSALVDRYQRASVHLPDQPRTDLIFWDFQVLCHPTFGRHLSYQCMRRGSARRVPTALRANTVSVRTADDQIFSALSR